MWQHYIYDAFVFYDHRIIPSSSKLVTTITVTSASMKQPIGVPSVEHKTKIRYLEHVVIEVTINLSQQDADHIYDYTDYFLDKNILDHGQSRRGDVSIELESPQGTISTILPYRATDYINTVGYEKWPFSSLHFWGEDPTGDWKLTVHYRSLVGQVEITGLKMKLFGTKSIPESVERIPKQCAFMCARGCASAKETHCDSCKEFTNPITLECLPQCPNGTYEINSYCINPAENFTYKYQSETDKLSAVGNFEPTELPKLPNIQSPIHPSTTIADGAMSNTAIHSIITSIAASASPGPHSVVEIDDKKPGDKLLIVGEAEKDKYSGAGSPSIASLILLAQTTLCLSMVW